MYNLYNLEATSLDLLLNLFQKYLTAEKITKGSIRSYLSDTRHFLSWLDEFLASNGFTRIDGITDLRGSAPVSHIRENPPVIRANLSFLKQVNQKVLEAYKEHQINNVPTKTINRRFSALRKFGNFCQSQGWCVKSPFDTLRNISPNQPFQEENCHLGEFKTYLWQNNSSKATIKNYLNDVKQFISWSNTRIDTNLPMRMNANKRIR